MNWYIENILKSFKDKIVSGLTDSGDFVTGKVLQVKPDIFRKYLLVLDLGENKKSSIYANSIRKISEIKNNKNFPKKNFNTNFCGYLYNAESSEKTEPTKIKMVTMTKKEPHTGNLIAIRVPSTHILNENK
jgi:hypothetical protein